MNNKEFEKTIVYDELAQTNGIKKFMLKSYLSCLLNGGKTREHVYLYAVGREYPAVIRGEGELLEEVEKKREELIKLFEKLKLERYWKIEDVKEEYYDKDGILMETSYPPTISKRVITKTETTYFLDPSLDIQPLVKKIEEVD